MHITRRELIHHTGQASLALSLPLACASTVDLSGGIDPSREWVLAEKPSNPQMRDAVNVWIEEQSGKFALRIGVEALGKSWDKQLVWLDVAFADGTVYSLRDENGPTHAALDAQGLASIRGSGPAQFQCLEAFKKWRVSFNGPVPKTTASNLLHNKKIEQPTAEINITVDMEMAAPPWAPGSMLAKDNTVLQGEQADFISPRYEQLFRCAGALTIDGKPQPFSGNGLRIRRQGVRKFEGFWGHCWQSAVFPSGKAFGFNVFPPRDDGQPSYNEGYIFTGSGGLQPATAVVIPWLRELTTGGDNVSFELTTNNGQVSVSGTTFINTRSMHAGLVPDDFPIVQQAHAHYTWEGESTVGMVERSSVPALIKNP
ncbi:hypothetical protein [Halioxenophilus aromaticivorans]|uniref:Uncharacterized protein n=1 Tax=Halioxenophilus aromaticivorans TaxID=1306992 RepID=A0AAV3U9M9_9ALTE